MSDSIFLHQDLKIFIAKMSAFITDDGTWCSKPRQYIFLKGISKPVYGHWSYKEWLQPI